MATLYGAQGVDRLDSRLYTIDSTTGGIALVNGVTGAAFSGLAFDFTDGTLYGATRQGSDWGNPSLLTLDPVTGLIVDDRGEHGLPGDGQMADIACDSDGVLYGLPADGVTGVCTIDKATGVATSLGGDYVTPPASAANFAGGLAFDGTDLLAFSGTGDTGFIYRIDRATGDGTLVAALTGYSDFADDEVTAVSVGPDGVIYAMICRYDVTQPHVDLVTIGMDGVVTFVGATLRSGDALAWDAPPPHLNPAARTFEGRAWKWIVRDLKTSVVLTSITTIATDITTSRLLAAPWPASLTVPADDPRVNTIYEQFDDPDDDEPFVAEGIRVLVGFRDTGVAPLWECAYTGIIFHAYDAPADDVPYTKISAWDARKYLDYIPLVDEDGELPGPDGIAYDGVEANVIARAALENWITNNPGCLAETIFDLTNGVDETCAPVAITFGRGTMVGEVWSQLEQMGAIDIVLDPVHDPAARPGVMSVVNFEAEHGAVRPAAIFAWGLSPRSLPEISRLEDGTKRANTIQYFTDNIEPADQVIAADSIEKYGEYWEQRAWPDQPDPLAVAAFALQDLLFRKNRQSIVSATPAAARAAQPVQDYDIGDRAPFYASKSLRKPIAGQARIYGIPFVIGDDARESVQELIVSADAVA